MFEAALSGLGLIFHWPAIGYLGLGIAIGLYFGAVPGLSGLVGMAILLPFTFEMDPVSAFAFLLGMYAVTTTSDTIASVLLGIPGTAASQATILDGYPMAMRGEAARAFGAAFSVSMVGGVLGAFFLALSIPIFKPMVLSFASPEFFMLGVLGLTMVGALSGASILKGLAAAALGLLLSMIGYAEQLAIPRYWFDMTYLLGGLPLVPLVLGLFALPELLDLAVRDTSISRVPRDQVEGGMLQGVLDAVHNWWLVLRSAFIGVYVGMLPGLGGSIVDWIAYGHAVQSAKDKSQFGKGDVRGVIAPETANNAMKGGALIPTLAFGIPGSPAMAILLGAFLIQGLTPGPEMLTTKLDVTFSMVATLIIANVVGAALLMVWGNQIAKITFIRGHLIIPAVILFVFMGAWMNNNHIGDWVLLLVVGVVGAVMKYAGWPRPPLVLGFILGPIMENALYISMRSYGLTFLYRPICVVLAIIIVITLVLSVRPHLKSQRGGSVRIQGGEGALSIPSISLPFTALGLFIFAYAIAAAQGWPKAVKMFPLTIAVPGVLLCLMALLQDARAFALVRTVGTRPELGSMTAVRRSLHFFVWLFAILGVTLVAGQLVALGLFVAAYLMVWGGYRWLFSVLYAGAGLLFLYVMFDQVIHVIWYPSLLF
ncbi:MAG: tripartite tricarboxylate transporter permease [Acidobacteriota bacterium]